MQGKNSRKTVGPTLGFILINEHFEAVFTAAGTTQIVFQQAASDLEHGLMIPEQNSL